MSPAKLREKWDELVIRLGRSPAQRCVNHISEPDTEIPPGFRGVAHHEKTLRQVVFWQESADLCRRMQSLRTVRWRSGGKWQLAEGRKRSEEVNRLNHQTRVEKIINRSGIQPLHRKCTFCNYRVQNAGQRHALSQAKSIAAELEGGCTNFVFSGRPGTGKNHLAAAIGNRLMEKGRSIIIITVSDVMSVLHDSYDNGKSGEKIFTGALRGGFAGPG